VRATATMRRAVSFVGRLAALDFRFATFIRRVLS
jgi:hypothetical protein